MDRFLHDPFRLERPPGPKPVAGDLQPPLRLVEDDDLCHTHRSVWLRGLAAAVLAVFAMATILTAAASSGASSLLTGGLMLMPSTEQAP